MIMHILTANARGRELTVAQLQWSQVMSFRTTFLSKTRETLIVYWELVRIIVPVAIVTQLLQDLGAIRAVAPVFEPIMAVLGLPPELALAWLTGLMVGIWGGIISIFALTSVSTLTTADMTVFSALVLVAHAIPIEQKIIQRAGPGFVITSTLRVLGAFIFAFLMHRLLSATGWLATPLQPTWTPMQEASDWSAFLMDTGKTLLMMLIVLLLLSWLLELLKTLGIMAWLNNSLAPLFRLAGIDAPTVPFASVGLFLGISYGAGLLIRESRTVNADSRQVFIACVFMGFTHSIIEDTLVVVALGADFTSVFFGRLVFAALATTLIAKVVYATSNNLFHGALFHKYPLSQSAPQRIEQ
jgi:spore maturation protein SpmB